MKNKQKNVHITLLSIWIMAAISLCKNIAYIVTCIANPIAHLIQNQRRSKNNKIKH